MKNRENIAGIGHYLPLRRTYSQNMRGTSLRLISKALKLFQTTVRAIASEWRSLGIRGVSSH